MARITYVKKAQQRYETVPVIDPETGQQKVVPVMRRDGTPKKTKRGTEVVRRITVEDHDKPLPPYTCGYCHEPIEIGTPYKHVTIKSGPYGGHTLRRHTKCPTWRQSELTTSKMAGIYAAQEAWEDFLGSDFEEEEDVQSALEDMASEIRSVADEYRESATNIEDGFGHETFMSEELNEKADELESWADEIESADVPSQDEFKDSECEECGGSGKVECEECGGTGESGTATQDDATGDYYPPCEECDGNGEVECEVCGGTGEDEEIDLDAWREAVQEIDEPNNCPV